MRGRRREAPNVDDDVADPTDLVAERVEHAQAGQAADEDARRGAHAARLSGWSAVVREAVAATSSGSSAPVPGPPVRGRGLARRDGRGTRGRGVGAGRLDAGRRTGRRARTVHSRAQRSTASAGALSRPALRASVAGPTARASGPISSTVACTVSSRPPVSLLRRISRTSSGNHGRVCSPGPDTAYTVSSAQACQNGQARSPGGCTHIRPGLVRRLGEERGDVEGLGRTLRRRPALRGALARPRGSRAVSVTRELCHNRRADCRC